MNRRSLIALVALVVVAIVVVGVLQSGSDSSDAPKPLTADEVAERIAGAPPKLAAVHEQSSEILEGGEKALKARIAELRGTPIVVNVWGSWCEPCRREAPILQRVAVEQSERVAFLGVDTQDPVSGAKRFLAEVPAPYPSYHDPKGSIAQNYGLTGTPSTIFYDRRGKPFVHAGEYKSKAALEADLRRYALGG